MVFLFAFFFRNPHSLDSAATPDGGGDHRKPSSAKPTKSKPSSSPSLDPVQFSSQPGPSTSFQVPVRTQFLFLIVVVLHLPIQRGMYHHLCTHTHVPLAAHRQAPSTCLLFTIVVVGIKHTTSVHLPLCHRHHFLPVLTPFCTCPVELGTYHMRTASICLSSSLC
jgi:hypothetical protein